MNWTQVEKVSYLVGFVNYGDGGRFEGYSSPDILNGFDSVYHPVKVWEQIATHVNSRWDGVENCHLVTIIDGIPKVLWVDAHEDGGVCGEEEGMSSRVINGEMMYSFNVWGWFPADGEPQ